MPSELRDRLAADYQPVRALRSPWARALWVLPLALIALLAAPIAFNVRPDATRLGWLGVWGFSLLQSRSDSSSLRRRCANRFLGATGAAARSGCG